MDIELTPLLAVIGLTSVALVIDLKCRRIPNWLTISTAVVGLMYHGIFGGLSGLGLALGGFAVGFGFLLLLWLIGSGGGGDVKLMGAIGMWLGAQPTLVIFIGSAAFAVLCTVALMVWRKSRPARGEPTRKATDKRRELLRQTIPYALPVTLSIWTLFVFQIVAH
ncbi:MAG: prepilin peptidase [Planctomycetales bacterium]|nr:prepilin peptidase [Planctomycetales bacterium]